MSTLDLFRHDFVLSVNPDYANKIVDGKKTAELRRRFPLTTMTGAIAYIYATSPVQAIIGFAIIKMVQQLPVRDIWQGFSDAACIAKDDFETYFAGIDKGHVVVLDRARRFRDSVSVDQLKARFGFVPPQSFCYADESYRTLLKNE
jgi:predicted transcriptional regulator